MSNSDSLADKAQFIRSQMPAQGLFANETWRTSPVPFPLGSELAEQLEGLGRVLMQFYRAANLLYRQSVDGKEPTWVAQWLDQGKPASLIQLQRETAFKNDIPKVIRPDLLLTDSGLILVELDSVPGGIGVTAWLNKTYTATGAQVLGAADGMQQGFAGLFPQASRVHIVISEEASGYRPEMEWMCAQLDDHAPSGRFVVEDARATAFEAGDAVYRFFELFDVPNVPNSNIIFAGAKDKRLILTPPPKPIFEEKMLFALLWNRNLREFWHRELGAGFFQRLRRLVPYSWIVDPTPMPPHAAIPELNLTSWQQLKSLSQRERNLILKISGFSDKAWGARGVYLGSDLSTAEWSAAVDTALDSFPQSPYVLQRFHKPALVQAHWFDFERHQLEPMAGRVRLCPYYFVAGENGAARANLGGVLATICPSDKKIVHGMPDAILAPCCV